MVERAVAPLSTVKIKKINALWTVEADPLQLELAILNLAFNARDAMPDGGTLTISAERCSGDAAPDLEPGDYVALSGSTVLDSFDLSHTQMINAPKFQASFSANLDQPISGDFRLVANVLVSRTSSQIGSTRAAPSRK